MELSKRDARKIFLKQQGLLHDEPFGRGINAALGAIRRLSYLQIDTISVVSRAHHHVLQSRVSNFEAGILDRLMLERSVYEYWSHAAAYMPFDNFRYSLPLMHGWKVSRSVDQKLARSILARIRSDGPLRSKDFEAPTGYKSGGWWEWKPAKQVLEHLFLTGELMVSHRQGFQKVFGLPDNIIPTHVDTTMPDIKEWSSFIVRSMIEALGMATEYDLGYAKGTIRRLSKVTMGKPIKEAIATLCKEGELIETRVDGRTYYCQPATLDLLPLRATRRSVKLLSPFDNLVINRRRTLELFDFDYQIECYLPPQKRRYGYFSLPILYGDALIGRLDASADRKTGQLEIRSLLVDIQPDEQLINALKLGLKDFANKLDCQKTRIDRTEPERLKRLLPLT